MNNYLHDKEILPKLSGKLEWEMVSHGESGDRVYSKSDKAAFAKIANDARLAALEAEFQRTQWLSAQQIGSPRILEWIKKDGAGCLVTSTVSGVPASELSPADLLNAWPSISEKFYQLHQLPVHSCPFQRKVSYMAGIAADVVRRNAVNIEFLDDADQNVPFEQLLELLQTELPERISQEALDLVVCHGDACMPNIMVDPSTLICTGFIDLGRLGIADRYVDLSLLLGNTRETWLSLQQADEAFHLLFNAHNIVNPDQERLSFYLRLDPLTWG